MISMEKWFSYIVLFDKNCLNVKIKLEYLKKGNLIQRMLKIIVV